MSHGKRDACWALVILTIATLCCFHKLVMHPTHVLVGPQNRGANDLTNYYIPSRDYAAQTIHEFGELPLWNPYVCLGLPYTGNPQSAVYYPPNWLCHVWPAELILSWLLVAHHLFAGAGVYFLARRYGLGWGGSVVGGIVFLAAPFLIAQSGEGHYAQVAAVAWAPWAFLAYESVREGSRRAAVMLALCLGMSFFCGHVQETYYLVLLLTGLATLDVVTMYRQGRRTESGGLLMNWVRIGCYTAGIVAVDLVPSFISSRMSLRPSLDQLQGDFGWASFHLDSLLELLSPFALTRPELWEMGTTPFWEKVCYFGIVPLVLAVSAVFSAWNRTPTRRMACLWLLTLLFAFGTNGPVYSTLSQVVPGMSWFRLPCRVLFFTSFATSVLAAISVDELLIRMRGNRKDLFAYAGVSGVVAVALFAGWYGLAGAVTGDNNVVLTLDPRVYGWLAVPALLTLLALARPDLMRPVMVGGLLAACVLEPTLFASQVTETAVISTLEARDPDLLDLLRGDEPDSDDRVLAFQELLSDGDACRYGVRKVRGYDPAGPAAYLLLLNRLQLPDREAPEPMGFLPTRAGDLRKNVLDLLGVRHVVQLQGGNQDLAGSGWSLVQSGVASERITFSNSTDPPLRYAFDVHRNETPLPRAYVVGTARELSSYGEFDEAIADIDFHEEVILEEDILPDGPRSEFRTAEILEASPNRIAIAAELDAPGYLVLTDLSFPGWRVVVGGQSVRPVRANMAFRAIPLPAGRHEVVFSFQPPGLMLGASVSAAALLVLLGSLLVKRDRSASTEAQVLPKHQTSALSEQTATVAVH